MCHSEVLDRYTVTSIACFSSPCSISHRAEFGAPFDMSKAGGPVLLSLRGGRTLGKTGFSAADWPGPLELGR